MRKVVLIGGAPTVGKSFTARRISEELKMPWISTDTVREMMRKIVDKNKERTRKVVFERGLWDDAGSYPDSVKEIEVEWATLFNEFIRQESSKYGYKPYEVTDRAQLIINLINELKG